MMIHQETTTGLRHFFRYWALLLAYCLLIYLASTLTSDQVQLPPRVSDKLVHFVEFAVLGLLATRALMSATGGMFRSWEAFLLTVLFAAFYGSLDELHQSFVPSRTMDFWDLVADVAGATTASALYFLIRYLFHVKKRSPKLFPQNPGEMDVAHGQIEDSR